MIFSKIHFSKNVKHMKISDNTWMSWSSELSESLYYVNESDGDTWMFNEEFKQFPEPDVFTVKQRISPKPNRLIIFDGLCYHTASNPINSDSRVIININYKKVV